MKVFICNICPRKNSTTYSVIVENMALFNLMWTSWVRRTNVGRWPLKSVFFAFSESTNCWWSQAPESKKQQNERSIVPYSGSNSKDCYASYLQWMWRWNWNFIMSKWPLIARQPWLFSGGRDLRYSFCHCSEAIGFHKQILRASLCCSVDQLILIGMLRQGCKICMF